MNWLVSDIWQKNIVARIEMTDFRSERYLENMGCECANVIITQVN